MSTWCSRAVNRIFGSPLAACRTRSSTLGPLSRLGVRYGLGSSAFSLVSGLPSTISFGPPLPSFDRFVGTMPLCDSRRARGTYRSSPSPTDPPLTGCEWLQGLSVLAREVSMHAWGLRLRRACDALAISRTPQCCLPVRLTPSALLILAFSELTISGYPAYMCPCPTLQVRGCAHRPHMARGQDGFAIPFLYEFSISLPHAGLSRRYPGESACPTMASTLVLEMRAPAWHTHSQRAATRGSALT